MNDDPQNRPPSFWQMLQSVLAAAFGVQSGKNRARDFTHGKPSHFIVLGVGFTLVFVLLRRRRSRAAAPWPSRRG